MFSKELAIELPKSLHINKYAIDLEKNKQLSYILVYSLGLVEPETLKTYIKTNIANSFI